MARYYTIYIADETGPLSGLTPTWRSFKNVATGTDESPAPSIAAIGGSGWYRFAFGLSAFDHIVGVIDAGASVSNQYRYIPIDIKYTDFANKDNVCVQVAQVYDEDTDALTLFVNALFNGIIEENIASVGVYVYDDNHNEQFNIQSTTQANGVFALAKSSPDLVKNRLYYVRAYITTTTGNTYWSVSTFFTLE